MTSDEILLVRELIALQAPRRALPLTERRRDYDRAEGAFAEVAPPPGEVVDANGCVAEWVLPPDSRAGPVVVYLHGGAYAMGSRRSHRHLASAVGRAAGAAVLLPDYRLAPEHPFPAALEDAVGVCEWLSRSSTLVILVGDSAGGGLVVATMVALRDKGLPMPAAGICISPWADLGCSGRSYQTLASRDPLLCARDLRQMASWYLGDADFRAPLASPVYADLRNLPPLLIQVGSEEVLLDDARALARRARASGVEVELQVWPDMVHVWHWYFPVLPEGRRALEAIGNFVAAASGPRTRAQA